jgi:hypothetical protein
MSILLEEHEHIRCHIGSITQWLELEQLLLEKKKMDYSLLENSCLLACKAIDLMMETASTSETLVNFYQSTCHYNLKDSHLIPVTVRISDFAHYLFREQKEEKALARFVVKLLIIVVHEFGIIT